MNYIDLIKNRIKKEVEKTIPTKEYVETLFDTIKGDIFNAGSCVGLPEVDETTLESYFQIAKNEFLSVHPIDPGISHSLTKKGFISWLTDEREKEIKWNYSERYFRYLLKTGRSKKVVEETESSSLSILKKIADPKSETATYKKGLVVGAVQSGKTGNFNAVINRAIDAGYVLIIVLSGIMEDLRSQTQKRIETDVIGEGVDDSGTSTGVKGVGEIVRFGPLGGSSIVQVKSITSDQKDFGKTTKELDFTINDKYVLVCKKNVSVLRNLIVWLHDSLDKNKAKHNIPFLILDDEADNASLNNLGAKGQEYASRTNSQIRSLLALFNIKTYLGYTATPFANVLQDRNEIPENKYVEKYKLKGETVEKELDREGNIFPDDFIELLQPPSNYVGAKQIFETITPIENATEDNEKLPLVAPPVEDQTEFFPTRVYDSPEEGLIGVENFANKEEWDNIVGWGGYRDFDSYSEYRSLTRASRKEDPFPEELPDSLKDAVRCFILVLALRESRIPHMENSALFQPHNTMLIHVSRFTLWQNTTRKLVSDYVDELVSRINIDNPSSPNSIYAELEKIWYRYYAHIVENIKNYLPHDYKDEFLIPIVYKSLKNFLPSAIKGIEVKAVNSQTKEKLEYPKSSPKKYIAIGGNRLSRGFTLEGLTINYFIRTTNYSDTLLQMGRWFGYRPGYIDCCKIFTTQESLDKFNSTTMCIEELEGEFVKMEEKGKDPSSFVLRVKKHPGTLRITRPSILKNAVEVKWSYQDQLEMTTRLSVTKERIELIWDNFRDNIAPRFDLINKKEDLVYFKTNGKEVIDIIQNQPNNFDDGLGKDTSRSRINEMVQFIKLCNDQDMLTDWIVALKVRGNSVEPLDSSYFNINPTLIDEIKLARRSGPKPETDDKNSFLKMGIYKASGKSANIISSNTDLALHLSGEDIKTAAERFYKNKANELRRKDKSLSERDAAEKARGSKTIPERYYREKMTDKQGILVIYLFDSHHVFNQKGTNAMNPFLKQEFLDYKVENNIDLDIPMIGYALGFPPIENDPGGVYMKGDYDLDLEDDEEGLPEDANETTM